MCGHYDQSQNSDNLRFSKNYILFYFKLSNFKEVLAFAEKMQFNVVYKKVI